MIYILISTTLQFVLHAIKTACYIISSPVFGSQTNFFHGNSFTYLQFFSSGVCFFLLLFFVLLPIFFCHFQVAQFFSEVPTCQGLDSCSRLIVTLSASQTNKSVTGGVSVGGDGVVSNVPFSTPEPTILLACGRNRELWEQPL